MNRLAPAHIDKASRLAFGALIALIVLFLTSPVLLIAPISLSAGRYLEFPPPGWSLQWYVAFFHDRDWLASVLTSLEVAALATTFALAMGIPAALALARSNVRCKALLFSIIALPAVFPVIVSAIALYYVFSRLHLTNTIVGLALAHTILGLPVVVIPVVAALRQIDPRLEWQAASLGASRLQALRTVTLPLISSALVSVVLFAFITSFDEVVIAIFLTGGDTTTLPVRIWQHLRFEIDPTVTVVATLLLLTSLAVIGPLLIVQRRALTSPVRKP